MWIKNQKNRIFYIFIAIICLCYIFLGSKLIVNLLNIRKNSPASGGAQPVFSYANDNKTAIDNLLVRTVAKSNSYMDIFFQEKSGYQYNSIDWIKENMFIPFDVKSFLKAQFPAVFSLVEDDYIFSNDRISSDNGNNSNTAPDENGPIILEDLVIVDDLMEGEEGELLEDLNISNSDSKDIPKPENIRQLKVNKDKPYVFIYHTHATEAFLPIKVDQCHTVDSKYNMLAIGEIISKILEEKGHKLIYNKTYHDSPSYNGSYTRSLNTLRKTTEDEKNLKVIFDVHRDGISEDASYKQKALAQSKTKINGKDVATFSLVIGPDSPNTEEVLKFAKYIKMVSDKMYPGLCKGIIVKPAGKFNQYVSNYYALIEVGSNLNTLDEAKESAKLIGQVLSVVINNIQE